MKYRDTANWFVLSFYVLLAQPLQQLKKVSDRLYALQYILSIAKGLPRVA